LANQLLDAGHTVTLLNDGDQVSTGTCDPAPRCLLLCLALTTGCCGQAKLSGKAPFSQYAGLAERGASVVWGSPADPSCYPAGDFDVVYDNNGKDMEACQPLIDAYKARRGCVQRTAASFSDR